MYTCIHVYTHIYINIYMYVYINLSLDSIKLTKTHANS